MRQALFFIAMLGLIVSGYLTLTYITGGPITCGSHGCDTVRASAYAQVAGIPTPLFGVAFYIVLAVGALLNIPANQARLRLPLMLLTGIGVVVSAALTYIEAFVIDAWCSWCVASAVLTVLAAILVWLPQTRQQLNQ